MRTTSTLATLLVASLLICMIPITNAGSAPTNGGVVNVTSDETWNIGSELNAIVTVEAGATLTIEGDYTLPVGASITVAEGGTLRLDGGSLTGGGFSHAVRMIPNVQSSLTIDDEDTDGGFDLTIVAADGMNMSGWAVTGDNRPSEDLSGSEHVLNFPAGISSDYQLNFTLNPGSFTDLVIDHLVIDDGNTQTNVLAYRATPVNTMMAKELGTQFPLSIDGTAHFDGAAITGADIMIAGAVTSTNSHFTASGPLNVMGDGSSLSLQSGSVTLSSADHDINLDGVAALSWDGTAGTGGVIDRWERNIGQQEIHIPIGSTCTGGYCVEYKIHNHGPSEGTMLRQNVDGVALVPGRTVEIGWADGTVWTENASVEIMNFRTAWNLGSTMSSWSEGVMVPLPWDVTVFEILPHLNYPVISIDSVELLNEAAKAGTSTDVEVTVTNSGDEPAAIFIRCNIAGTDNYADMTPTYSAMMLHASETATLSANWTYHSPGEVGIDCYVEEPFQFIDAAPFLPVGAANSTRNGVGATVSWTSVEDDSSSAIIMLAALGVTLIIGLGVVMKLATSEQNTREIQHDSEDENGRVDRFAEMMDEDDDD
ncbi:MAG: hypothetical protein VYA86_04720 [Candidatus Thermoplasmatota archaeon]|nr:hypothetical protein [Candidatus Thermoplasmatota archaeon]